MKPPYLLYAILCIPLAIGVGRVSWGYHHDTAILTHLTFHFAHASVWHLTGNALCFYILTRKGFDWIELWGAYIIATLCSFIAPHELPTIGISGLIFALYGMRLPRKRLNLRWWVQTALILLLPALTGRVNVLLHISCLCAGYIVVYLFQSLKQIAKDARHYY